MKTNTSETLEEVTYVPDEKTNAQELKPDELKINKPDTLFLYFTVLTGQLITIVSGAEIVWTSPAIPKLLSNNTEINPVGRPITTVEVSMIGGIPLISGLTGSLILARFSDAIGRKKFLHILGAMIILIGIFLAFSNYVLSIIISRSILIILVQTSFANLPVYVAEICEDHNRAKFGCFLGLFHQMGHFYCYVIGPFFNLRDFTLITLIPGLIYVVTSFLIPESPFYLLSKSKDTECSRALRKLRCNKNSEELKVDLSRIRETLKRKSKSSSIISLFKTRENRIGLMLGLLPCVVQHFSGISAIMLYLAPFFNSAGTSFSGNTAAIIVGSIKISTFTVTSFIVERLGKKRMLLISAIGTGLLLSFLGVFFYLKDTNSSWLPRLQWLPLPCVLLLVFIYSLGLGPIPMGVMMDMFPSDCRPIASTIVLSVTTTILSLISFIYPIVAKYLGIYCCVLTFSCCCFIGAVLIYIFLPETKGKSLTEIQDLLKKY